MHSTSMRACGCLCFVILATLVINGLAITKPDQFEKLRKFRDLMVTKSPNWVAALESWKCPTDPSNSDAECDPCGRTYEGNWKHMHCRGPSKGSGESSEGVFDGQVSNVHICDVHLEGPVPRELCMFDRLRELDLDGGRLTGPFPDWIPECFPTLAELDLSYNRLSGTLPVSITKLPRLQEVKMEYNQFSGPIPEEYGRMRDLRYLRLESNRLTGKLPASLSLANTTLSRVDLAMNDLEGDLSPLGPARLMITTVHSNPRLCGMVPATIRYAKGYNPWGTNLGRPCPS